MDWKNKIDLERLPKHIAVIMDGNGRWAKEKGKPRVFGHRNGVKSVREITEGAAEIGVEYLTLYAFSTENWKRPKLEISALMRLLVETVYQETNTLMENNIRLQAIGEIDKLPKATYNALLEGIENTKNNTRMTLVLALNYSGRWDITQATQKLAASAAKGELKAEDINAEQIAGALSTHGMPDPELLIRTSGENRISNFLLWELAYAEFYFSPVFWPDFRKPNFYQAIVDYQQRERRFGKISEQIA
ncbi:isoprenyl transferase [Lewinella cohaerens]|uniref:isoprenyl transferase n=1 Tax=Lewinella cohaerens TaxID=70995 RepID=UPI0003753ED0|nr:isoprenyl transferase [Lewinella cohaerens]